MANSAFTIPATGGSLLSVATLTSGSGTYTVPAGVGHIMVECLGGGGGSGGCPTTTSTQYSASGGGGGGGYCRKFITTSSGATFSYAVGAAGAAGTAGANNGGAGGNTTFGTLTASGGGGGTAAAAAATATSTTSGLGANGGSASGGDLNLIGGNGNSGTSVTTVPIQGFGGGSVFNAVTNIYGLASATADTRVGTPGQANQGGGAGGSLNFGTQVSTVAGAAGGSGIIIIWQYS